jgi:hypothetical protein
VVHIEVDDRDSVQSVRMQRVARGDGDVVEDAEPHRSRAAGVVSWWTHAAERGIHLLLHDEVGGEDRGARGAQGRLQGVRIHRRVRIEVHAARLWRSLTDRLHVFDRMNARELLVGGQRGVVAREERPDTRSDQLILDRGQALGPLGMLGAHVVPEAIGVRQESGRHG